MSPPQRKALLLYHLGEAHYRPSEQPWREAGSPSATVGIGVLGSSLVVFAHVQAGDALFAAIDAINPYDNEHPDTMRAGIQLYVSCAGSQGAWMLVPDSGRDGVRIRPIVPSELQAHGAAWRRTDDGYELRAEVTLPSAVHGGQLPLVMDVIINETVAGRERRRGQLVMSGARGESVYLRGDRHPQERLIPMRVVP